jgi:hypothetical protein
LAAATLHKVRHRTPRSNISCLDFFKVAVATL